MHWGACLSASSSSPQCLCRIKQGDSRAETAALLEATLVSPQAIETAFGADSVEGKAATKAVLQLLQVVQNQLADAFEDR